MRLLLDLRRRSIDYVIIGFCGYQATRTLCARGQAAGTSSLSITPRARGHGRAGANVSSSAPDREHSPVVGAVGIDGPVPPPKIVPQQRLVEECLQRLPRERPIIGVHFECASSRSALARRLFLGADRGAHQATRCFVVLTWSPGRPNNPLFPGDDDSARAVLPASAPAFGSHCRRRNWRSSLRSLAVCRLQYSAAMAPRASGGCARQAGGCPLRRRGPQVWYPWGVPHRVLQPASKDVKDLSMAGFSPLSGNCCANSRFAQVSGNYSTPLVERCSTCSYRLHLQTAYHRLLEDRFHPTRNRGRGAVLRIRTRGLTASLFDVSTSWPII